MFRALIFSNTYSLFALSLLIYNRSNTTYADVMGNEKLGVIYFPQRPQKPQMMYYWGNIFQHQSMRSRRKTIQRQNPSYKFAIRRNSSDTIIQDKHSRFTREGESTKKPSLISIIFGFLVVGIGVLGIFFWIIIFYLRHRNLKNRREVEKKRSANTKAIVTHQKQQDSSQFPKKIKSDCKCFNTDARNGGYAHSLNSGDEEDSFALRLQNTANYQAQNKFAVCDSQKSKEDEDELKKNLSVENETARKHEGNIKIIQRSSDVLSLDANSGTNLNKSWAFNLPTSKQKSSLQKTVFGMPEQNMDVFEVEWSDTEMTPKVTHSNIDVMLGNTSSFDSNYQLIQDIDSINISFGETNFSRYHNMRIKSYDEMNKGVEIENGFLNLELEKSGINNEISENEYLAALNAAKDVLRQTDLSAGRISSFNQVSDRTHITVNNESTCSVDDNLSTKGDMSLLEVFNDLRNVSRFVQKYEQNKRNATERYVENKGKKSITSTNPDPSTKSEKLAEADDDSSFPEEIDRNITRKENVDIDYKLTLKQALNVIKTHKQQNMGVERSNHMKSDHQRNNIHIEKRKNLSFSKTDPLAKNNNPITDDGQQSEYEDIETSSFPSLFARRLGITPYVPKTEFRSIQSKANNSDSIKDMAARVNKQKSCSPKAIDHGRRKALSVDLSVKKEKNDTTSPDGSIEKSSVPDTLIAPSSLNIRTRRSQTTKHIRNKSDCKDFINVLDSDEQVSKASIATLPNNSLATLESTQLKENGQNVAKSDESTTGAKTLISLFETQRSPSSTAIFPHNIHWQYGSRKLPNKKESSVPKRSNH